MLPKAPGALTESAFLSLNKHNGSAGGGSTFNHAKDSGVLMIDAQKNGQFAAVGLSYRPSRQFVWV
jgi:hypothetical protein